VIGFSRSLKGARQPDRDQSILPKGNAQRRITPDFEPQVSVLANKLFLLGGLVGQAAQYKLSGTKPKRQLLKLARLVEIHDQRRLVPTNDVEVPLVSLHQSAPNKVRQDQRRLFCLL
jgi:hypothetical protein